MQMQTKLRIADSNIYLEEKKVKNFPSEEERKSTCLPLQNLRFAKEFRL